MNILLGLLLLITSVLVIKLIESMRRIDISVDELESMFVIFGCLIISWITITVFFIFLCAEGEKCHI